MTTKTTMTVDAVETKVSMRRLMHAAFFTPEMKFGFRYALTGSWGLNLLFIDKPGTGKSSAVAAFAESLINDDGAPTHCEVLSPGESGEGAYGRIPVPVEGVITYPAPEYVFNWVKLNDDGTEDVNGLPGLLFQDEFNTGGPVIQSAQMGLTLARRIAGRKLPNRVRTFAAMNEEQHTANGAPLAPALANRVCRIKWNAGGEESWCAGLLGAWEQNDEMAPVNVVDEEARTLAAWPAAWRTATTMMAGFIKSPQGILHQMADDEVAASMPSPTNRSVFMAVHAYAAGIVHNLTRAEVNALLAGFCGETWLTAFRSYEATANFPTAEDVLDGKVEFKHTAADLGRTFVVLQSCVTTLVDPKCANHHARAEKLWAILADCLAGAKPEALDAAKALSAAGVPSTFKTAITVKASLVDFEAAVKKASRR